jgi:hypothetical protein
MNELLNDDKLTTADIFNSPRTGEAAIDADLDAGNDHDLEDGHHGRLVAGDNRPPQPNPLFQSEELNHFRSHWGQIQTSFVDEPRAAVEQADNLVANVVKRIAEQFASEREQLEKQWDRGEDADTEELRLAFKRYRAFFDRLLSF